MSPTLQRIIHLRALEETERENPDWPADLARHATQTTREKFPNTNTLHFLTQRANHYQPTTPLSTLPQLPVWLTSTLLILAFIIGWSLAALGQESEINLLALPLLFLVIWNFAIIILSILAWFKNKPSPLLETLTKKLLTSTTTPNPTPLHQRFLKLATPTWLTTQNSRLRLYLHLAAAILALGSITGMYARGWSKEYRAVWESTLLNDSSATTFFNTTFKPASILLQIPIPSAQIPAMQRGIDHPAPQPAPALPWIHLYAGSLLIIIVIPRLLFVSIELLRASQIPKNTLQNPDWQNYLSRLLALTDGIGSPLQILVHAQPLTPQQQDHWRLLARQQWPEMGTPHFIHIPAGSEPDFIESWSPPTNDHPVLLIFNLASVPETEVHHWLANAILQKWNTTKPNPTLHILLDESSLHRRWSGFSDYPERIANRRSSWQNTLLQLPTQLIKSTIST